VPPSIGGTRSIESEGSRQVELWRLLKLVQQAQGHSLDFQESYGLTAAQFSVLSAVVSSPGIDQRTVSEGTFIGKSTLAGVVNRLVAQDLMYAVRHPEDARRDYLLPSRTAMNLIYEATPELLKRNETFLSVLPRDKAEEFLQALEVVGFTGQEERRSKYVIHSPDGQGPVVDVTWGPGRLLRASLRRYGQIWADQIRDITAPQAAVLAVLSEQAGLSQRALGDLLGTNKASVAEMVGRMLRRNFISRTRDPADRRRLVLQLTPEGTASLKTLEPSVNQVDAGFLQPLAASGRELLLWGLGHLVEAHRLTPSPDLSL